MIDIKRKLCSRKFWMAVVGLVSGLLMAFKVDAETVETVSGVVMAAASVIAYVIGEGLADAANADQVIEGTLDVLEDEPETIGDADMDDGK